MARRAATTGAATRKPQNPNKSVLGGVRSDSLAKKVSVATPRKSALSRRKFLNEPCEVNGIRFDSKIEAARYMGLMVAERMGEIKNLEVHPRFPLVIHGQDCGDYIADFAYQTTSGERVIEDVKSPTTRKLPTYRLKARMVWALYGLKVREVMP